MPKFQLIPPNNSSETWKDVVLKWVLTPGVALLTLDFSVEYFTGLWGDEHTARILLAGIVITALEVYLFRQAVLAETWLIRIPAAVIGLFIGGVSVLGSLGAFEMGVAENVLHSDQYQGTQQQIQTLTETNQKLLENVTPQTYLITNKRVRENQQQIRELQDSNTELAQTGNAGTGNALFASLGDLFQTDVNTTSQRVNGYTSLVFEVSLIFLSLIGAYRDKQKTVPGRHDDTGNPVSADSKPRKKRPKKTVTDDDEYLKLTPQKITEIINDCLRMRHKSGQFKGAPMYSEIGRKYGCKRQTIYRVFKEHYLDKSHHTNGHYQTENVV